MAWGYHGRWPTYVTVAQRRKQAERQLKKLRNNGQPVSPVTIEGRTIARTFWGKAWCDNLETYRDYENRLPRGRSYVRNGLVLDLQVSASVVKAIVSGSSIYNVTVTIKALVPTPWRSICVDCTGGIDSHEKCGLSAFRAWVHVWFRLVRLRKLGPSSGIHATSGMGLWTW